MKITKEMMRQLGLAKPRTTDVVLRALSPEPEDIVGGPLKRYGGKGRTAPLLIPHFARAKVYAEACVGAGSVFYAVPAGTYERHAINDLDSSVVTFFRVLRDRPDDLVRVCSLTPYAKEEFEAAFETSEDELEEARRMWVRSRQSFAGKSHLKAWGRNPGESGGAWGPQQDRNKLSALYAYAKLLGGVSVDCVDAAKFIDTWGREETFVYVDPPYVAETRRGSKDYKHELDDVGHRRFALACHAARNRGARVAVSGYQGALYEELYAGWRRIDVDVPLYGARNTDGQRRVESLWCSYDEREELRFTKGWGER